MHREIEGHPRSQSWEVVFLGFEPALLAPEPMLSPLHSAANAVLLGQASVRSHQEAEHSRKTVRFGVRRIGV